MFYILSLADSIFLTPDFFWMALFLGPRFPGVVPFFNDFPAEVPTFININYYYYKS